MRKKQKRNEEERKEGIKERNGKKKERGKWLEDKIEKREIPIIHRPI